MPGLSIHSSKKGLSRSKANQVRKNANRVDSAITGELEGCTFGKIIKAIGNKRFMVYDTLRNERISRIMGSIARISVGDIVLLNEREYETRSGTDKAMYDIVAVFTGKDISRLVKDSLVPSWFTTGVSEGIEEDLFDHTLPEEELDIDTI